MQFRYSDIDDLRNANVAEEATMKPASLSSQTREMLDLNRQLQSSAVKNHAKTIEIELRKLEVSQATEHVDLLKVYFNFWRANSVLLRL
jgi:dynactin 1